ncbi:MAG: hypothetical protein ACR2KT_08060 [Methylocella sp.]|nr:MAG: hypothetical protein DLM68_12980 [Hyphomicrobiales bacterium]
MAAKLWPVLSLRMAIRLNSLILQKKHDLSGPPAKPQNPMPPESQPTFRIAGELLRLVTPQ